MSHRSIFYICFDEDRIRRGAGVFNDMAYHLRSFAVGSLLTVAASIGISQTREARDPFSLASGTQFSASSGSVIAAVEPAPPGRLAAIRNEIAEAHALITNNHVSRPSPAAITKSSLSSMLKSLDPHSNFHSAGEWKELHEEQRSGYTGIGVTLAAYPVRQSTATFVVSVSANSPAARHSLRFGDRIVAVDGKSTVTATPDQVRDLIRGRIASYARITVERDTGLTETLSVPRERVSHPSIPHAFMLNVDTGYIGMTEGFTYTTCHELENALQSLKQQGMRSLVLDLRGNGGGIVDQAVCVAGKFLAHSTAILSQRGRSINDNRDWRSTAKSAEKLPLVLIVDEETASAAEIVAGALQDNDRALIVGEKTFGKGLVQSVIDLPGSTGVTLTTARYLTPTGRSIQRDYAATGLYDYFAHRGQASSIGTPYFEARTITGRRVIGGDGIQPDEIAKAPLLNAVQTGFRDAAFRFVREELPRSPWMVQTDSPALIETTLNLFARFLKGSMSPGDARRMDAERQFVRTQLAYNLALANRGAEGAQKVLLESDPQIIAATALLTKSAGLAASAQVAGRLSK